MPTLDEIASDLSRRIEEAVSVIVARRSPGGGVDAEKLALAESAAEGFRDLSRETLATLQSRTLVEYTADAELETNEVFILDDKASLDELSDLRSLTGSAA